MAPLHRLASAVASAVALPDGPSLHGPSWPMRRASMSNGATRSMTCNNQRNDNMNHPFNPTSQWQRIGLLGAALTTALALLTCGGNDGDPLAAFKSQKLAWSACDPTILGSSGTATLEAFGATLAQFGSRLGCANMRAPLDYADPSRGEVSVALMRIAAEDPAMRQGAIWFNPGGPGGDGLILAPLFAATWTGANPANATGALYKQMSRQFDIVGFSPRGTGASTRLYCGSNESKKFVANSTADRSQANIDAMLFNARLIADACAKNPLTPYINTDATVRDMDLMRHLMGEAKLNYYGISYGTWLGTWYATVFPERVGRMMLSGVVDQEKALAESFLLMPMGHQRTFDQVIVPYAARHSAMFSADGSAADLGAIFSTLDTNLQVGVSAAVADNIRNASSAYKAVLAMVAGKKVGELLKAPDVAALIASAQASDVAGAAALVSQRIASATIASATLLNSKTDDLDTIARGLAQQIANNYFDQINRVTGPVDMSADEAVSYAVVSNDYPMSLGVDGWIQATNRNASTYPLAGGLFSEWPGLYWRAPSVTRPPLARAAQAGNILLVHNDLDAVTPLEGAEKALAELPNASMVLFRGEITHGTFFPYGQACADDPVARFFLQGTALPRRTQCPSNALMWDVAQPAAASLKSMASARAPLFTDPEAAARLHELFDQLRAQGRPVLR